MAFFIQQKIMSLTQVITVEDAMILIYLRACMTFWSCYNNKKNIKGKKGQQASRHMVEEDTKKKKRDRTKTNKKWQNNL